MFCVCLKVRERYKKEKEKKDVRKQNKEREMRDEKERRQIRLMPNLHRKKKNIYIYIKERARDYITILDIII